MYFLLYADVKGKNKRFLNHIRQMELRVLGIELVIKIK